MIEFTDERRAQIVALLGIVDEGLPEQRGQGLPVAGGAAKSATPGFVTGQRARTCPDCLANGRTMKGCETCRGSGTVTPARLGEIATPDAFDDDLEPSDPYAVNRVEYAGVGQTTKVGHVPARDAEIDRMSEQLRDPWLSPADELADANRNPYPWERRRAELRRRFDLDVLTVALDELRASTEPGLAALLIAVYGRALECRHAIPVGHTCRICGVVQRDGLIELSATLEAGLDRALRFVNERLPDPIRAPGHDHPALRRRAEKLRRISDAA